MALGRSWLCTSSSSCSSIVCAVERGELSQRMQRMHSGSPPSPSQLFNPPSARLAHPGTRGKGQLLMPRLAQLRVRSHGTEGELAHRGYLSGTR